MPGVPRVKSEPGPNISPPGLPPMHGLPAMSSQTAQQRAATHLQQRYGSQAAAQIGQLQAGQRPHGMQMPAPLNQDPQNYPPMAQQQRPSVSNAQTDGAGDSLAMWKAEVARRRAEAAKGGPGPDHLLMEQVKAAAKRMEGGGLMAPLDEYSPSRPATKSKGMTPSGSYPNTALPGLQKTTYQELIKAQYDGPASDTGDGEADEDAINSDLDDPEDVLEGSGDEDEGATPNDIMLCTYDKVQRVKNKWKCTLKDGLMTTGQREYVFPFTSSLNLRWGNADLRPLDMCSTRHKESSNGSSICLYGFESVILAGQSSSKRT
jgi:transcription initiation factor TFIIA large subunit